MYNTASYIYKYTKQNVLENIKIEMCFIFHFISLIESFSREMRLRATKIIFERSEQNKIAEILFVCWILSKVVMFLKDN